jgi:DNA-binding beta-propeller fold protein YncE
VPGGSEKPGVSRDGRYVFGPFANIGIALVGKDGATGVHVIDTVSNTILKTIRTDSGALAVRVDSRDRILIAQYQFGNKTLESATTNRVSQGGKLTILAGHKDEYRELGKVPFGTTTLTLHYSEDGRTTYAANRGDGTVTVVDLDALKATSTVVFDPDSPHEWSGKDGALRGARGMAIIP